MRVSTRTVGSVNWVYSGPAPSRVKASAVIVSHTLLALDLVRRNGCMSLMRYDRLGCLCDQQIVLVHLSPHSIVCGKRGPNNFSHTENCLAFGDVASTSAHPGDFNYGSYSEIPLDFPSSQLPCQSP